MLSLWTIYDRPTDFPDSFVARRFELDRPTNEVIVARDLEALRDCFRDIGLYRLERWAQDDPKIVEVWV